GIGTSAVLHDLIQIASQRVRQFFDLGALFFVGINVLEGVLQFVNEFGRDPGEIVDEIERVLDLVCDTCGKLTKRCQFLRLHQAVLRCSQVIQGSCKFVGPFAQFIEQPCILNGDYALSCEVLD